MGKIINEVYILYEFNIKRVRNVHWYNFIFQNAANL